MTRDPSLHLPQMSAQNNNLLSLTRLAWISAAFALVVIVFGAFVRLSNAGLSCPDWPTCYGEITWPTHAHDIAAANAAFPDRPVESDKTWREQVHRILVGGLGVLTFALAGWALPAPPRSGTAAAGSACRRRADFFSGGARCVDRQHEVAAGRGDRAPARRYCDVRPAGLHGLAPERTRARHYAAIYRGTQEPIARHDDHRHRPRRRADRARRLDLDELRRACLRSRLSHLPGQWVAADGFPSGLRAVARHRRELRRRRARRRRTHRDPGRRTASARCSYSAIVFCHRRVRRAPSRNACIRRRDRRRAAAADCARHRQRACSPCRCRSRPRTTASPRCCCLRCSRCSSRTGRRKTDAMRRRIVRQRLCAVVLFSVCTLCPDPTLSRGD